PCIVAHERQAWHVGASALPCHPRRAPDVSGILLARTETAARLGRRWRARCETALQSERVGAAYEDALACTPSPASRVSATSLSGCWPWGCTGWCAARSSCWSSPAQGAFTHTRSRSRASRSFQQGSGRSPGDSAVWLLRQGVVYHLLECAQRRGVTSAYCSYDVAYVVESDDDVLPAATWEEVSELLHTLAQPPSENR